MILPLKVDVGECPSIHSKENRSSSENFPNESTAGESSDHWTVINMSKSLTQTVASSVVVIVLFAAVIKQASFDFRNLSLFFFMNDVALAHLMYKGAR